MATHPVQARQKTKRTAAVVAKLRETNNTNTSAGAALVDVDKPLTTQQKRFATAYARGETVSNAMVRAGYDLTSTTFGYRMLKMPNIQAHVARERALFAESNNLTRQKVQDMFVEAYDMAKLISEPTSMVAAAREMAKMAGFYEPVKRVIDINVRVGSPADIGRKSDAELIEMIEKASREAQEVHALVGFDRDGIDEDDEDLVEPA